MNTRSRVTLAGIAVAVAVLALTRGGTDSTTVAAPRSLERPTILDFGRGTCLACREMMPVLDAVRDAYRGIVDVDYVDLTEAPNAARARAFAVRLIPTQVFLATDGTELFRHEGFLPRTEIDRKIAELGWLPRR